MGLLSEKARQILWLKCVLEWGLIHFKMYLKQLADEENRPNKKTNTELISVLIQWNLKPRD